MELCEYGCGKEALFTLKNGRKCCKKSANSCEVNRRKNSNGVKQAHLEERIPKPFEGVREWWKVKTPEEVNEIRKRGGRTRSKNYSSGITIHHFKGKKHTNATREKLSKAANNRNNGFVKTKWYKIWNPYMNTEVSVQGTYELEYAKYLNSNSIKWERSKNIHLRYKLSEEDYLHYYYPDFFLPEKGEYIEIKGRYWKSLDGRVDDQRKMQKVIEYNMDKKIIILFREDLLKLNINIL
jgi:hypothetical protein